jgi:dUTP pyrophosphatase
MEQLKVKRLREDAIIPKRGSEGSGGLDLCACTDGPVALLPGGRAIVSTGLAIEIPGGFCGFIFARSGLGVKRGIIPSNAVGVIDSDYRGEIHVGLINHGEKAYTILPGERIAQLILLPVGMHEPVECESLSDTARGEGGLGSTGR